MAQVSNCLQDLQLGDSYCHRAPCDRPELKKCCPSCTRPATPPTLSLPPLSISGHSWQTHRDAEGLSEHSEGLGSVTAPLPPPTHQQPRGRKGPVVQWPGRQ